MKVKRAARFKTVRRIDMAEVYSVVFLLRVGDERTRVTDLSYDSDWGGIRDQVRLSLQARLRDLGLPDDVVLRLSHGGRLNRASLFFILAEPGADEEVRGKALRLAVALEMIHKASVIRDDIEDSDLLRRGLPTEPAVLGVSGALTLSDVLLADSLAVLARLQPAAMDKVLDTFLSMSRGQFYDQQSDIKVDDPFMIAEMKTGSLVALVFWMGALCAGRPSEDRGLLHAVGLHLGAAFQLANDVNNVTRDEGRGKKPGSDLTDRRNSSIALLLNMQSIAGRCASEVSIETAVEQTLAEISRRLREAQALASLLEQPLPKPVHLLVFDEETARMFVSDQQ